MMGSAITIGRIYIETRLENGVTVKRIPGLATRRLGVSGMSTIYTMKLPSMIGLMIQSRLADCPVSRESMYCVRSGDQSSGSTIAPASSRLITFIATIKGGEAWVVLFVMAVPTFIISPTFT